MAQENREIRRILHLKCEIRNGKLDGPIRDFGFEVQDSSDFTIFP
jgi:hypothetical protein